VDRWGRHALGDERRHLADLVLATYGGGQASGEKDARFLGRLRDAIQRYPGDPYIPFLGAVAAHHAGRDPLPWANRALERDPESEVSRQRVQQLLRIYREPEPHYDLFLFIESLIQYDELFTRWRLRHVLMVERMIGNKPGTGGSEGATYLRKTAERKFFPELWELRSYLSPQPDTA
jgi:tryptophan 2,3-dioxygenase